MRKHIIDIPFIKSTGFTLALCFLSAILCAQPVELNSREQHYFLGRAQLDFLEAKGQANSLDAVMSSPCDSLFSPLHKNFSFDKKKSYWIRFAVQNKLRVDRDWLVLAGYPSLADAYIVDSIGNHKKFSIGTFEKAKNKPPFESIKQSFPVSLNKGETKTIYIHLRAGASMSPIVSLSVIDLSLQRKKEQKRHFFQGLFFGLIAMMFLYNLFLYFSTKDSSYLYYVLFVLFMGLFFLNIGSYTEQLIQIPTFISLMGASQFVAFIFYFILLKIFSAHSIKSKLFEKWINWVIRSAIGLTTITVLVLVIDYDAFILISSFVTALIVLALITLAVVLAIKGDKLSRYFFTGTLFMLLGVVAMLFLIGKPAYLSSYLYPFELGVAAEIIVFSLGLSYRYKLTEQQRLKAQEDLIEQLKNNERLKDEANQKLEQKVMERTSLLHHEKLKVEKKNRHITDSINYASRIQQALLPTAKAFENHLPKHFILYKPKDIVSGDFYYLRKSHDKLVVAAADCTGHGVPGALVSMLGIAFLNEILAKHEMLSAAQILGKLRTLIKNSLQQTKEKSESKDGMDIALCLIDTKTNKLQYAGAYNPLYLIRNSELIEIKATRNPIGVYIKEKQFVNNDIDMQDGDVFYIFSDGFADQFGGKENKKYLTKNFKALLQNISTKPLAEQKTILNNTIESWKDNKEQNDDILVIGFSVNNENEKSNDTET